MKRENDAGFLDFDPFVHADTLALWLDIDHRLVLEWVKGGRLPQPDAFVPLARARQAVPSWRRSTLSAWLTTRPPTYQKRDTIRGNPSPIVQVRKRVRDRGPEWLNRCLARQAVGVAPANLKYRAQHQRRKARRGTMPVAVPATFQS